MTCKDGIFKAENICLRIQTAVNALEAVHTAMAEGPDEPKEYIDGLFYISEALRDEAERLHGVLVSAMHGQAGTEYNG